MLTVALPDDQYAQRDRKGGSPPIDPLSWFCRKSTSTVYSDTRYTMVDIGASLFKCMTPVRKTTGSERAPDGKAVTLTA